jgi:hypothetical protein
MTPLQNDPQQHQREAKHRKCRVSRWPDLSPDSDSARKALQKSGLGSELGKHKFDSHATSGRDGGTTTGAPVDTGPTESHPVYNRRIIDNPLVASVVAGNSKSNNKNGNIVVRESLRKRLGLKCVPETLLKPSKEASGAFVKGSRMVSGAQRSPKAFSKAFRTTKKKSPKGFRLGSPGG